jgi:hypothetical protein
MKWQHGKPRPGTRDVKRCTNHICSNLVELSTPWQLPGHNLRNWPQHFTSKLILTAHSTGNWKGAYMLSPCPAMHHLPQLCGLVRQPGSLLRASHRPCSLVAAMQLPSHLHLLLACCCGRAKALGETHALVAADCPAPCAHPQLINRLCSTIQGRNTCGMRQSVGRQSL